MKLDILAISAHPDDVELGSAGTVIGQVKKGNKVGVIDLTRGEMGTRGTPEIRDAESAAAAKIMGLTLRGNTGFRDVFFKNDEAHQLEIIKRIRQYQPEIIITNAVKDRHPDHARASELVSQACFMAGLRKIETVFEGEKQSEWRPKVIYHFIQSTYVEPDIVVDISDTFDDKMKAIKAYGTQFYNPDGSEPETFISSPQFLQLIEARAVEFGKTIGVKYGEGFTVERFPGVRNLFDLI
ncbi:MAG: bacillithiol biosynthesis deacetylase BshB1 [Bacteroidetes bacterium]|nr:bacillithiol biosynthesis deacetylase BshB1 [Bacteroidota bacterium]